jgi:hypothetical protein
VIRYTPADTVHVPLLGVSVVVAALAVAPHIRYTHPQPVILPKRRTRI